MENLCDKRLADTFPPSIRRKSVGLSIADKAFNDGTLPDKGNHRQSSTLQCGSGCIREKGDKFILGEIDMSPFPFPSCPCLLFYYPAQSSIILHQVVIGRHGNGHRIRLVLYRRLKNCSLPRWYF